MRVTWTDLAGTEDGADVEILGFPLAAGAAPLSAATFLAASFSCLRVRDAFLR